MDDNVIQLNANLRFRKSDKNYIYRVCKAFEDAGLPHILYFGETDEGQEWCIVSRTLCFNDEIVQPVAEITKIPRGYRHVGGWGVFEVANIEDIFAKMPLAYEHVLQNLMEKTSC